MDRMNTLKRAAAMLQNSAEEFEAPDGLSICIGIDAWNEFFEVLGYELERAQAEPVNQQMLAALKELRDAYQEFMGVPAVKANAAIAAAERSTPKPEWADAERISSVPAAADALRAFSQDSTGDNAIAVVLAIMEASSLTDRIEGETQNTPGSLRFFAYDSEVGFERFNTEAEARKFVQELIDEYRALDGDGWPEEVENLCWGVVLGTTKQVPVPDDGYDGSQGVADSGPFVDYVLTNYTQHAPVNQQMLEALNAAKIGLRDWEIPENRYKAQYAVDAAIAAAEAADQANNQVAPVTAPGLYAVLFLDNWDGEGDVYHMLAELLDSGKWVDHRSGRELLEYEGDSILKVWPLNDDKATQVPPRDMLMRVARSVRAACFEACNENGGDWAAIASLDLADVISDAMAEIIGELGTTEIAGHGNNQVEPISVPAGWKLVPIEPTSKMIVAGSETDPQFFAHAQFVYRAMLAAAPTQEGGA